METAQKAGHGTKTHGFKKALGGYAISTNLQMVREATQKSQPPPLVQSFPPERCSTFHI